MAESNKMKDIPVNKLMIRMGIPMILSMALQAVYNIVDSAFVGNMKVGSEAGSDAHGSSRNRHRCWHECTSGEDAWTGKSTESGEGSGKQLIPWSDYLCSLSVVRRVRCESIYFLTDR